MKKIFSFLLTISLFYTATAQQIVNRAGPANTVQDQRLAANLNFILPRFTDTAQANNSIGIDLCGAQIYTTNDNTIWYRQCLPKRWIKIMSEITGNCGLTFGGLVTGSGSGLTLDVTSAQYCIANSSYYFPGGNITLSPADPLYDRFDALALDNTGSLIKITGTPAPNPAIPTINQATQVFLTAVQVKAGSGSLGTTQFLIWDENAGTPTEWADGSTSTYNPDATILPVHGSKHIIFSTPANNNNIRFTGTPVNSVDYNTLKFFIKLSAPLSNFRNFTVLINTSGALPNTLTLTPAYGFNKNDTNYQNITIPLADFNAGTCTIEAVIIRYTETSDEPTPHPGFYLDYLTFNGGTSTPPVLNNSLTNVYKVAGSDTVFKTINGINSFAFNDNTTDTAAIIIAEKVNDTTVRYCRRSGYCFYVTIVNADSSGGGFDTSYRRLDSALYKKNGIEKFSHLVIDSTALHAITTPNDSTLRFSNLRGGNTDVNLNFYDSWSRIGNDVYRGLGNVGISTNQPKSKLHIVSNGMLNSIGSVDSTGIILENKDSTTNSFSAPTLSFKLFGRNVNAGGQVYSASAIFRAGLGNTGSFTQGPIIYLDGAGQNGVYTNNISFNTGGTILAGGAQWGSIASTTNFTTTNLTSNAQASLAGGFSAMSSYNSSLTTAAQFNANNRGILLPRVSTSARDRMDSYLDSVKVTGGGAGYTSAPNVGLSLGGGFFVSINPTATATISGGSVTGTNVTNQGLFYSNGVTVSFSGGGGSGATGVAYTSQHIVEGTIIYNTDIKRIETWDGTAWRYAAKIFTGTAAPATTPEVVGDTFIDTVAKKIYVSTGTASSSDWTITN